MLRNAKAQIVPERSGALRFAVDLAAIREAVTDEGSVFIE
jgi:hypothetical protein